MKSREIVKIGFEIKLHYSFKQKKTHVLLMNILTNKIQMDD